MVDLYYFRNKRIQFSFAIFVILLRLYERNFLLSISIVGGPLFQLTLIIYNFIMKITLTNAKKNKRQNTIL